MNRFYLSKPFAGAALGAISLVGSVNAQAQAQEEVSATPDVEAGDAVPDIIVTAQKRSQSLQKVPAAVTSVDSATLQERGITDVAQLNGLVPSGRLNRQNNAVQLFIRGVGFTVDLPFIAEPTAMQTNGTYTPPAIRGSGLYDIERVEILPGPQGTLYGRSAIGGVITVVTKRPEYSLGGEASLELGNNGLVHVTTAVNIPLGADNALRWAFDYNTHGSYDNLGTDTLNGLASRLSFVSRPTDDISIFIWAQAYHNRSRASQHYVFPLVDNPRDNLPAFDSRTAFFYPPRGYPRTIATNRQNNYQIGGQIDWDLGAVTLTYLPGYTNYKEEMLRAISGFPIDPRQKGEAFSNELRLSGSASNLNWLLGLYQFRTDDRMAYTFGPNLAGIDIPSSVTTYAGFGEATYSLADDIRITAGGRHSWSEVATEDAEAVFPVGPTRMRGVATYSFKNSWTRFDWKAGVEADLSARSLLYGHVQTGFNPGSFRPDFPLQGTLIRPQKMIGYTAGTKNRLFDSRLQLNGEVFYYRYTDQMIQAFNIGTGNFLIFNAPRSRMYGAQLDAVLAISPNTQIRLGAAYLNAKIVEYVNGPLNLAGKVLPLSPEWTVNAGLDQSFPLSSGAEIRVGADSTYNSGYFLDFANNRAIRQKSFSKTNLNVTYVFADGRNDLGLFVRNLEDNDIIATGSSSTTNPNTGGGYLDAPRSYGVRFRSEF